MAGLRHTNEVTAWSNGLLDAKLLRAACHLNRCSWCYCCLSAVHTISATALGSLSATFAVHVDVYAHHLPYRLVIAQHLQRSRPALDHFARSPPCTLCPTSYLIAICHHRRLLAYCLYFRPPMVWDAQTMGHRLLQACRKTRVPCSTVAGVCEICLLLSDCSL